MSLTAGQDGRLLMHTVDCPYARWLAEIGEQVVTLLEIQRLPDADLHSCLEEIRF